MIFNLHRSAKRPAILLALALAWCFALALAPIGAAAQETAPADAPAAETATEDAATEETAPAFPPALVDPTSDIQEFGLRILPLTVDELTELAAEWQSIVRQQTAAVSDATLAARAGGKEPTDAELDNILKLTEARSHGFDHFKAVLDDLAKKGGDEALIAKYRTYRAAVLVEEKRQADARSLMKMAGAWIVSPDGGLKLAKNVVIIIAAFLGLLIVARIVRGYAKRLFTRIPDLSMLLQAFLTMVVYWLTIAVGLMVVLSALGVDVTPLFAVLGGASFIIAFAMQDTLGNLAAGLMIMFNRPFDQGDYVTAGGTSGTVQSVSVVSTTVATPDNQIIVIPNSKVWGDVITNTTASDIRRVDLVFGIGYDDSIEEAQAVLEQVVAAHPAVLDEPATVIRVSELADSSVNFIVRPWTKSADYWAVLWDLTRSVKEAFDAKGISIPYPQTDMHVKVPGQGLQIANAEGSQSRQPAAVQDFASGDDGA